MDPHEEQAVDETALRLFVEDPLALEERDDLPELVPSLPAQTFVQLARSLRSEGRLELIVPHASGDQLARLLDLEVWHRDRIDAPRARGWLLAIVESFLAKPRDRGDLVALMYAMDPEMWTFALHDGTRVIELDPERDDARDLAAAELAGSHLWESPDGAFMLGVPDDEIGQATLRLLEHVYADSLQDGRALVLSILGALPSQVEDDLLRWRKGRLSDLGFVEWEEARRLLVPLDREAAATAGRITSQRPPPVPPLELERQGERDLLSRALALLDDGERGVRAREFMLLVNEVMAVQRFEPGDVALQERALHQARATVGLGLELLLGTAPDPEDGMAFLADRLVALGLRDVFRVGYGALDRLRRATLALHRGGRVSLQRVGSMLDRPWGPAIGAFAALYPELPLPATSAGTRPIRSLRDVARATELVAQAGALATLAFHPAGYAVDPVWIGRTDEPEKLVLGDLVRTAAIHVALPEASPTLAPLTPDDVAWAAEHLVTGGRIAQAMFADFTRRCHTCGLEAHAEALAENLLGRLLAELTSLERDADGEIDLTRTGGLLTVQQVGMWLATRSGRT